jgi:hypothetical protein
MPSRRDILCHRCLFPIRRGRLPILWPSGKGHANVFCSIACWEATSNETYPEPLRTWHLEIEGEQK